MPSAHTDHYSSDDPNDPLNWPEWKKSMTLLVIAIVSCCGDYGSATGSVAIIPQAGQWHISPNTVNHVRILKYTHLAIVSRSTEPIVPPDYVSGGRCSIKPIFDSVSRRPSCEYSQLSVALLYPSDVHR